MNGLGFEHRLVRRIGVQVPEQKYSRCIREELEKIYRILFFLSIFSET